MKGFLLLGFLPSGPFFASSLTSSSQLSLSFSFPNTRYNYEHLHRLIQNLCLHLTRSTPLPETPIPNHYLLIAYF